MILLIQIIKYPILLLLSASGKLYYVDLESALSSGKL